MQKKIQRFQACDFVKPVTKDEVVSAGKKIAEVSGLPNDVTSWTVKNAQTDPNSSLIAFLRLTDQVPILTFYLEALANQINKAVETVETAEVNLDNQVLGGMKIQIVPLSEADKINKRGISNEERQTLIACMRQFLTIHEVVHGTTGLSISNKRALLFTQLIDTVREKMSTFREKNGDPVAGERFVRALLPLLKEGKTSQIQHYLKDAPAPEAVPLINEVLTIEKRFCLINGINEALSHFVADIALSLASPFRAWTLKGLQIFPRSGNPNVSEEIEKVAFEDVWVQRELNKGDACDEYGVASYKHQCYYLDELYGAYMQNGKNSQKTIQDYINLAEAI